MSTKHILLVDDEEMVLELTETMLEALDYDVTAFLDVRDALKRFSENQDQFDLIITDQSMPLLSGVDFAAKIRELAPAMPVVIATGFTKDEILDQLDSHNVRFVLEKPFTLDTMGTLVEQALSS
jgi:DNA-binding NtrC family response regulator